MNDFKKLFPFFLRHEDIAYLDSANTSQILSKSLASINAFYKDYNFNIGRGSYSGSRYTEQLKEWAEIKAANFIEAEPYQIIFTTGATEGLNMIARSFRYFCKKSNKKIKLLTTKLEHASCIMPWIAFPKDLIEINYLKLNDDYTFNIEAFEKEMENNTPDIVLLSSMTNTTGEKRPLKEIGLLCEKYNTAFIVDHAQGAAHYQINVKECRIDFLCFSLHKMYGPKGLGVLYAKNPMFIKPYKLGGGMNKTFDENSFSLQDNNTRFYAGTENLEAIVGAIPVFDFFEENWDNIELLEQYYGTFLYKLLSKIPGIAIYSVPNSTILLFNMKNFEALDVMSYLDKKDIYIRAGNHCSKLTKDLFGLSTCRISLGIYNDTEDISAAYRVLNDMVRENLEKTVQENVNNKKELIN